MNPLTAITLIINFIFIAISSYYIPEDSSFILIGITIFISLILIILSILKSQKPVYRIITTTLSILNLLFVFITLFLFYLVTSDLNLCFMAGCH